MTATIIEEEVDADSILLLDFDHAPQCEAQEQMNRGECLNPAEYKLVLSCCAELWLLCEDHMFEVVAYVKEHPNVMHNPALGGCGTVGVHFTLIERL
jgi:hypothetical protein